MVKHRKFWILIAAAIAIVALFLLSSSLSTVDLLPGKPFPWGMFTMEPREAPDSAPIEDANLLITLFRIALLIFLPLLVLYMVFTKEGRKRMLRLLIQFLLFMFVLSFVLERQQPLPEATEWAANGPSAAEDMTFGPAPEFAPGDMQDLTTALSLVLAVILTLIIVSALYILWRRARRTEDNTLTDLAREAQDALDDIQTGGSLKNAVIRCYAEMSRVISEKRNIQRGATMTSQEFEAHLVKTGLPKAPVQELTRLFEDARYGDRNPGPAEEQRAVACLSTIVTAIAELSR